MVKHPKENKLPEFQPGTSLYRVMCVDPGLGGTGIAFWDILPIREPGVKGSKPSATIILTLPRSGGWLHRCTLLMEEFEKSLQALNPDRVFLEFQEMWGGSTISQASASSGDLFKLTYLTGNMGREIWTTCQRTPVLLTPGMWKGQLSKKAISLRIKRSLGNVKPYGNHIEDAIGMGLAIQGTL